MSEKSPNLTDEENNLCYEIKFALMRAISKIDHDTLWKMFAEAVISELERGKK